MSSNPDLAALEPEQQPSSRALKSRAKCRKKKLTGPRLRSVSTAWSIRRRVSSQHTQRGVIRRHSQILDRWTPVCAAWRFRQYRKAPRSIPKQPILPFRFRL